MTLDRSLLNYVAVTIVGIGLIRWLAKLVVRLRRATDCLFCACSLQSANWHFISYSYTWIMNVSKCTYFAIVTNSVSSLEFECNDRNYIRYGDKMTRREPPSPPLSCLLLLNLIYATYSPWLDLLDNRISFKCLNGILYLVYS